MGAELSQPLSPEEDAALRAKYNAEMDAERDKWADHHAQRLSDIDWPRARANRAVRDAREVEAKDADGIAPAKELAAAAAAAATEQTAAQPLPANKPKLLRSSKGDATPRAKDPLPSIQPDAMVLDSQEPAGMTSPLEGWGARKDRDPSRNTDDRGQTAKSAEPQDSVPKQSDPTRPGLSVTNLNDKALEASSSGHTSARSKTGPAANDAQNTGSLTVNMAPTPSTANTQSAEAVLPKRTATSAFADERRNSVPNKTRRPSDAAPAQTADLARIPKKAGASRPSVVTASATTEIPDRPPRWYTGMVVKSTRHPLESAASASIDSIKGYIKKAKSPGNAAQKQSAFSSIREGLHNLAFQKVSGQLLRNTRMLHNDSGLPQLFDPAHTGGVDFPWDIKLDAEELYNKWSQQIYETQLLRGIIPGKPKSGKAVREEDDSSQDRLDPAYEGKLSAAFHGNGLLLNGQWWPTQLAAVRDGAHGHSIAGIAGAKGEGAYSCVMSGGLDPKGKPYPDEDHGDWVLYCGTDSRDCSITENTQMMLDSERTGKPVRLIRSHNLKSRFAPEIGFRYDGLYKVVSHERLDPEDSTRQRHQFRLQRLPGQTPLRGGDGPEARPTRQEIEEHKKDKQMRGFK